MEDRVDLLDRMTATLAEHRIHHLHGHYPATAGAEIKALWDDRALVELGGLAALD